MKIKEEKNTMNEYHETNQVEKIVKISGSEGGNDMAGQILSFDWAKTPLGPIDQWPKSLRSAVNLILPSVTPFVILWGHEGIFIYNDAYSVYAGKEHSLLLGSKCEEAWPEVADFIRSVLQSCLSGESISYKKHPFIVYRNGIPEEIWVDLDCSPILGDDGKPSGVLIIHNEITHHILAEQGKKYAEDRFEVAMDAAGMVGTWDWHLPYDIVYSDPRFASLFSVTPEKGMRGAPMSDYTVGIHPEDRKRVEQAMESAIVNQEKYNEEYRLQGPDGTIRWIITRGQCLYDHNNKPTRFSGVAVDITDRKTMEEVLQESKDRFTSIFNQSSAGIAQTNLDGRFTLVNDRYCQIVDRTREELYQTTIYDITHPDDLKKNKPLLQRTIKHGIPFKIEKRYVRPNKTIVWVDINVSSVRNSQDDPLYILGVCQDVTKRKQAEKALAFQNKINTILTTNATVGLFMLDANGRTTFANPAAEKMTGYSLKEMEGVVLHDLVHHLHPDGTPFSMETCTIGKTIFTLGKIVNHEDVFIRKDGSFFPVLCSASSIVDDNKIVGFILEVQDITKRKQAEQAIKESEERFRIMADAAPNFVWALNPDTSLKYANKYALEFLGISLEKFIADNWIPYIHPEDVEITIRTVISAVRKRTRFKVEHRLLRHDGNYLWILTQGAPSYYPDEKIHGYIGSSIDISDRKETEKKLELQNEQLTRINNDLDNFIYTASHDLKAPISNIEGLVYVLNQSLNNEDKANKEIKGLIEMINRSVERFKATIKDLTEVAKVQNNVEEDLSELSFKEMLKEVKLNIKTDIQSSNALIKEDFSKAATIYFSKKNLRSILYNLISNALKYRSSERRVEVRITTSIPDKNHLLLTVQDNGLGIKEEDKGKVFTMFKRLHQHVEGTGIGLAIVKKIIDNNGGKIEIESTEGKGTTFKMFFRTS